MQLKQAAGQASLDPDKNAGIMFVGNKLIVVSNYILFRGCDVLLPAGQSLYHWDGEAC